MRKLRKHVNKQVQRESTRRLQEIVDLGEKAKKVGEILKDLKEKREQDIILKQRKQERRAQYAREKRNKEAKRKENLNKKKKLQEQSPIGREKQDMRKSNS